MSSLFDTLIDDEDDRIEISDEANFIWGIANKLRGSYMPDKYGDVVIPMTIIRRFECALKKTKKAVVEAFKKNPKLPAQRLCKISEENFYCTSEFTLELLCHEDPDQLAASFKEYIAGFSPNVREILGELEMNKHIDKMNADGCLYSVVSSFAGLDLSVEKFDSIRMGYIFENLIGRFFQNVDAGQFYTGRDIIKLCVSLLLAEGCDDIFDEGKIVTICDQAAGTGGMLTTAHSHLTRLNPDVNVQLFGQEMMGVSYAVGLAELLIKKQSGERFQKVDTLKEDRFPGTKMRFVLENPPFGTPWSGKDAKQGQEDAVRDEYERAQRGKSGSAQGSYRFPAGLPGGGDAQLLFMQSAVAKLDDKLGRAAIIENGSPLFTGNTASGESQIRRWLLENDLIEAIIQMPTELFYNTGISTYVWILSKNKRKERKGKIQLIDASAICHKLRKPLGNKKNEFKAEDRARITDLYRSFKENEVCKIFDNTEFIYREYAVMQPLQRSYAISEERVEALEQNGALKSLWDEAAVAELEEKGDKANAKEKAKLAKFRETKEIYDAVLEALRANPSDAKYRSPEEFMPVLQKALWEVTNDKKLLQKIADGLSVMDKTAVVQRDKDGNVLYDKETKDVEIVKWNESIEDYMAREVLPHVPDAMWFWEHDPDAKKPVVKIGAEIPFTRYFYKYQTPISSEELEKRFLELERSVSERVAKLFGGRK